MAGHTEQIIGKLKERDQEVKEASTGISNPDREWELLHEYGEDRARSSTIEALQALKMGIESNRTPIEMPVLRRLVRRLATTWKAPASRWMVRDGERLTVTDTDQMLYSGIIKRQMLNVRMRASDRERTLWQQTIVRIYPSDHRQNTVFRTFPPYRVIRDPSGSDPDSISADNQFAFLIGGEAGKNELWEHWTQIEGEWFMQHVLGDGRPADFQPFGLTGGKNPYSRVPALVMYAEEPNGRPWLNPRTSRIAVQNAINAKANDIMALVREEAHTEQAWAMPDEEDLPEETGPGVTSWVPKGAELIESSKNPRIQESISALTSTAKLHAQFEGLPSSDFDQSKTIVTGAALRVQEGELRELREEQVEMAGPQELEIFEATRAVHNVHAKSWGRAGLPLDLTLEVQLGDVDTPIEPEKEQNFHHAEIALRFEHPVQWIQVRDQVDEQEAIDRWQHTQSLYDQYPTEEAELTTDPPNPNPVGSPGGEREIDSPDNPIE